MDKKTKENNIDRLGVEDLLGEVMDRMVTGIGEGSDEQQQDWEHAKTYARRLQLIADKYKLDERRIR